MLAVRRRRAFVGRTSEIDLFRAALEAAEPLISVLHVHGPGGIGTVTVAYRSVTGYSRTPERSCATRL
jgi:hypothetical protein